MTPVLFDANETQFNSMGIGALADAISCLVHEARNGAFELTLEYPVDAPLFSELVEDRIIKAKANDNANMDSQLFRIYKSSKPLNGRCTFYAEHITGELAKNPITHVSVTNGTAQQFGQAILSNTVYPHRFTFVSSDSTTASSDLSRVPASQALVGIEGSLIDRWRGELTRDNFVIREEQNRGTDTVIIIEYGKNLTDAAQEKAIDETYTSIYPFATIRDAEGNDKVIELSEKIVESPYVGNYAYGRCLPIDLSGDDVTDEASLRGKAQAYVMQNDFGKPKVSLTINFVQLWQMEEYKNVAPLEHVNLCDWVTVRFKKLGIDAKVKVVDGVFDSKAEKWVSMELGDAKTDWQSEVHSSIDATNAIAQQAIQYAGQAIINADGTITFYSPTEPTGNIKTGSMWFKLVNGDYTEMWRYNGVSWDRIKSKDANDALNAANQAMQSANGKAKVWRQASEPTEDMELNDMWFRKNADGTETTFIYDGTKWDDPTDSGVKAAQDQANTAVATADAASAQASNALTTAQGAASQASAANSAAQAAQSTASSAASQASSAWNNAQTAINNAQSALDAYNNMQIGGRNLLLKTTDSVSAVGQNKQNQQIAQPVYKWAYGSISNSGFNAGDYVTISFDWSVSDTSGNYSGYFKGQEYQNPPYGWGSYGYPINATGTGGPKSYVTAISNDRHSGHVEMTFVVTSQDVANMGSGNLFRLDNLPTTSTITFSKVQIEKGNKATDWSPSPEDVQIQIDNINGTLTQKVSQSQFDNLAGTVSSQATQISQNQQDVAIKANKDYVDTINQTVSSQGAQITANAQAITQKADASTVNTLTGQVSTMSATLTTQANQIAARITSQDADAKYATQTALTATSSGLTSNITQIQTDLNKIGQTNSVYNSDVKTGLDGWEIVGGPWYVTRNYNSQHGGSNGLGYNNYNSTTLWNHLGSIKASIEQGNVVSWRVFVRIYDDGTYTGEDSVYSSLEILSSSGSRIDAKDLYANLNNKAGWQELKFENYVVNNSNAAFCRITLGVRRNGHVIFSQPMMVFDSKIGPYVSDTLDKTQFSQLQQTVSGISTQVSQKVDQSTYNTYISQTATTIGGLLTKTDASNTYTTQTSFNATVNGINTTVSQKLNTSTAASTYATQSSLTQTATTLQSNIDGKVGTDVYNSKVSQLSNDINARVVKNDVVHQINISTEGILIDGSKTHITGQTTIDNAVITNAMIASIDIGKATTGTLDANRIGAKSVTVDKLDVVNLAAISADLGWVNAGTLNAVDINASTFYASNSLGSVWINSPSFDAPIHLTKDEQTMDILGERIVSHGYVINNEDGRTYNYDTTLNSNGVSINTVVKDSSGTQVGALNANITSTVINLGDSDTGLYWVGDGSLELRSNGIYMIGIHPDTDVLINKPLRVLSGLTVSDGASVAYDLNARSFSFNRTGYVDNTGLFLNGNGDFELWHTGQWALGIHGDRKVWCASDLDASSGSVYSQNFINTSQAELKTEITKLDDNIGLSLVNSLDIYKFKYKKDVADGRAKFVYGGIIGDGYQLPEEFKDFNEQGVNLYSSTFIGLKAIQELTALHQQDILKIANLELRLSVAESKIALLEAA